jgi:apolipoprotein N-acyltransferase
MKIDEIVLGLSICFEDAFSRDVLMALPEANLLVNVSNDAWFGDSIAPHQHLQIARMRALEVGRYSIRATNTGISAFIGPSGKVLLSGPQFKPSVLTLDVERRKGSTPYARVGNWALLSICFLIVAAFWLRGRAKL